MRVLVFDLETSSLQANTGILLCACFKEWGKRGVKTFRADQYKSWKTGKTKQEQFIQEVSEYMADFDIYVAHNGQFFDKTFLTTLQLKYGIRHNLRFQKFIDPVQLSRRHLRMARNSLASLIDYFEIEDTKTPIHFRYWMEATLDGNSKSLDYIVKHCEKDVLALESVYNKLRVLVKGVDEGGSAR